MTTRGRCLLAGGLAAAVCAILLDERDLLRVGVFAAALPLVAIAIAAWHRPQLSAAHRLDAPHLTVGDAGHIQVRVSNRSRLRSPAVTLADAPVPGLTQGVRCSLPPLRAGRAAVIRYRLRAARRGRFTVGRLTATSAGPLGLYARRYTLASRAEVLVLPRVVPLVGSPVVAGSQSAAGSGVTAGLSGGDPDVRVRPYAVGDDVRTIHWRASAKRDDWVVRTRLDVSHGSATLLLDHRAAVHAGRGADASMEIAVSLAASVAAHLLSLEYQVRLVTHAGEVLAVGGDAADAVLVALAEVAPDERADRDLVCDIPAETGLILAVLGGLSGHDVVRMIAARPPSARGCAVILDIDSWPRPDGAVLGLSATPTALGADASAARLREGGWQAIVLRHGDDLAAVWQAMRSGNESGVQV